MQLFDTKYIKFLVRKFNPSIVHASYSYVFVLRRIQYSQETTSYTAHIPDVLKLINDG